MGEGGRVGSDLLRSATLLVAVALGILVAAAAWYITAATGDMTMALLTVPETLGDLPRLVLALAFMVVMMVAMMLPSAIPMVLTYHRLTGRDPARAAGGEAAKELDGVATGIFASAYFLVWGAFALVALLAFSALGFMDAPGGSLVLLPAVILIAAGVYQVSRPKEVCLRHCQSPLGFVMTHWRPGRRGALAMGLHHAGYCIGCCWLLMLVVFVAGAVNLIWMGILSIGIFLEKIGPGRSVVSPGMGVLLVLVGSILAATAIFYP